MKKLLLALLLPFAMHAQDNWLEQNIQIAPADSNHMKAMISGKAFELMSYAKPDSILTDEIMNLAKSVNGMVGYMELSSPTIDNVFGKMGNSSSFEEYAKVTRKGDQMGLFINQKDGVISEAVMLVKSKGQNMAMSVYGDLDMRQFGELYKLIPYQYMQELEQEKRSNEAK